MEGGHDIPESVVRRRFGRSVHNFFADYRQMADSWTVFDNSGGSPAVVAFQKQGKTFIMNEDLYAALMKRQGTP